ncbi:MAG: histidinol-phosphate transaminase [Bacteroidota bacterium]
MFNLENLVRPNIKSLVPYSTARDEFKGSARIFMDANENALGSPSTQWYNRYPDPHHTRIKQKISAIKNVPASNIFIGNGSDEVIDLLYRVFCEPGKDEVVIFPPTYGMYEVSARVNDVHVIKVPLMADFQLDLRRLEQAITPMTKMMWICSPNNPTGNTIDRVDIEMLLNNFDGIVVMDEAYINFSRQRSFLSELSEYPNLVIMQTLSKAWGLAGIRLGMAFASQPIIEYLNKTKPPYNISQPVQDIALKALEEVGQVNEMIVELVKYRMELEQSLLALSCVEHVYPSDANFLLVKCRQAHQLYVHLVDNGIVVRDRSKVILCNDCLRITVGTQNENQALISAMNTFQSQ